MPNRILREGILTSERVNQLTPLAELFYRRLMSVVDDFGRFSAHLSLLKANCYPLRLTVRDTDLSRWIAECETAGLVVVYQEKSRQYLQIQDFRQRLRVMKSNWPPSDSQPPPDDRHLTVIRPSSAGALPSRLPSDSPSDSEGDPRGNHADAQSQGPSRERGGEPHLPEPGAPTFDEVRFHADKIGLPEWKARRWFNQMQGCGWLDSQHRPVVKWQYALINVKTYWEADGRPPETNVPVPSASDPKSLVQKAVQLIKDNEARNPM